MKITETDIEWIEYGHPFFSNEVVNAKYPDPPDLTLEFHNSMGGLFFGKPFAYILGTCKDHYEKLKPQIERTIRKSDSIMRKNSRNLDYVIGSFSNPAFVDVFKSFFKPTTQRSSYAVSCIISYLKYRDMFAEYIDKHPKTIEHAIKCTNITISHTRRSFIGDALNKSGTIIEVDIDNCGTIERFLIGDINENGGVCDDCKYFDNSCIIVRYAVLFDYNVLNK